MSDDTPRRRSSKFNARSEVLNWLNRGVRCVPIERGQKVPRGGKDWQKLRITENTIDAHFDIDDSLGGLWGSPSNWVVDVDLDCDEAVAVANQLLPETFRYGRNKRPGSHFLYRCTGAATQKWMDDNRSVIVELRSTGMQSVLPPSIHPDKDQFRIEHDVDFTEIAHTRLIRLLNQVAALSLLVRHYPVAAGGRHDYISAIAGALSHSGIPPAEVTTYCEIVLDACKDRETDRKQRERTIKNTIEKAKDPNNRTYGWPMLSQYIPAIPLSKIRNWITSKAVAPPKFVSYTNEKSSIPEWLLNPPGLVGDIMKWSARSAYVVQPVVDLASAFMCMAMATMNRYVVAKWQTPLQPYMMVMAPTAGGKESALSQVYEFCRQIRLGQFCYQGFQSYHSMLDRFAEPPSLACWLWDEAGRKMKSSSRNSGSQDYQVMTWLLNLYGKAAKHVPGLTARGTAIAAMDFPFLTILAATQPSFLIEAVTEADMSSGLINRFLMFDVGDSVAKINVERNGVFPSRIETAVRLIRDRPMREGDFPFHEIQFDSQAYAMFREFEEGALASTVGSEVWGRANQNALMLAGLLAVGMGGMKVTINEECARWAIEFVKWSVSCWENRLKIGVSRSKVEGFSKAVEQVIRDAVKYAGKEKNANKKALLSKGFMPRSVLIRKARQLDKRELTSVIDQLIESELIETGEMNDMVVYWPTKDADD